MENLVNFIHACILITLFIKFPEFCKTFWVAFCLFFSNYLVFYQIFHNFYIYLFCNFSGKGQKLDSNGIIKSWGSIKQEFILSNIFNFKWQQLIHALLPVWKKVKKHIANILLLSNHYLINQYWETKFKEVILSLLVYTQPFTPTCQKYFNKLLKTNRLDWKQIYLLPCLVTLGSYSRCFQYIILNNTFYLNKNIFRSWKSTSPFSFLKFLMRQYGIYFKIAIKFKIYGIT